MADEKPEGGAPEGGDAPQGTAPATETPQVKPWWEARGYKSEADALSALDEGQRTLTELQGRQAALESTIKVLTSAKPTATEGPKKETPGYRRYFNEQDVTAAYGSGDPMQLVEVIATGLQRMNREEAEAIVARQLEARELRERFYRENSDLVPHEELVKFVSQQYAQENPDTTVKAAYSEIARRVRAKIAEIKKGGVQVPDAPGDGKPPKETLPHAGSGGLNPEGGAAPTEPKKTAPERDSVADEVARRVQLREKRSVLR